VAKLDIHVLAAKRRAELTADLMRERNPSRRAALESAIAEVNRQESLKEPVTYSGAMASRPVPPADRATLVDDMEKSQPTDQERFQGAQQYYASPAPTPTFTAPEPQPSPAQPPLATAPTPQPESAPTTPAPPTPLTLINDPHAPEMDLANQYLRELDAPAPAVPSPAPMDFANRVSMAAAGTLNPDFFRDVVAPQINARNPTPMQQLQLQQTAQEIKSQKLGQTAGAVPVVREARLAQEDAQTLHAGFSSLAQEFFGAGGQGGGKIDQLKELAKELERQSQPQEGMPSGRPDLAVRAKQMLGHAAIMQGLMYADDDVRKKLGLPSQPVTKTDLASFEHISGEADKLMADAYNDLDQAARAKDSREYANFLKYQTRPPATAPVIERKNLDQNLISNITKLRGLIEQSGALGVGRAKISVLLSRLNIGDSSEFVKQNDYARASRSFVTEAIQRELMGRRGVNQQMMQNVNGLLTNDDSGKEEVLSALDVLEPYVSGDLTLLDQNYRFQDNLGGPPPAQSVGAVESGYIDDSSLKQLLGRAN
jgi:hypothetical protein